MGLRTIHGTWEEVSAHADELRGKQVFVTVVEPTPSSSAAASVSSEALDALFARMDEITTAQQANGVEVRSAEEAAVEQLIVEKYRRQGLNL